jgi:hypothetical protein
VSCQIVNPTSPTLPENSNIFQDDGNNPKESPVSSPAAGNWLLDILDALANSPAPASSDVSYQVTLFDWLRHVQIYNSFELRFDGYAVLISPMMVDAYKDYVREKQGPTAHIDENIVGDDHVSFILAYYVQEHVFRDLTNNRVWSIGLSYENKWYPVKTISRYRPGEQVNAYFPTSDWTKSYSITFDLPPDVVAELKDRLGRAPYIHIPLDSEIPKNPLSLRMSSSLSTVQFIWDVP